MMRSARAAARTSATLAHALTRHAHVAATAAARQHPAHGAPQFIACTRNFSRSSTAWYADAKADKEAGAAEAGAASEGAEDGAAGEAADEAGAALAAKDEEIADWKDKYMRTLAEMENLRRRHATEIKNSKDFGIQSFSKDLVTVADVLEMAVENAPKEVETEGQDSPIGKLFEGMSGTQKMLQKVFAANGLETLRPEGEVFDPKTMDAQFQVPDPEKEADTVAVVTRTGYLLNDRVIRPAGVGVVQKL